MILRKLFTTTTLMAVISLLVYQVRTEDIPAITVFSNHKAVFTCLTRDGSILSWRVNGTDIDNLPSALHDDIVTSSVTSAGHHLFTLTILGRVEYNGTIIQCVAGIEGGKNKTIILHIQDLVATVKNIIVNSNATSFTISWTAPFSLDVTGVDPDIWYSVLIYNVTDEPTAVPCTDCMDITETHYTFTPDYPSPCQEYIFTVIPLNGAGQGPPSDTTSYIPLDLLAFEANISLFKTNIEMYSVIITAPLFSFSNTTVLCFGEYFKIYYDGNTQHCPEAMSFGSSAIQATKNIWQIVSDVQLGANCNYTVYVMSQNDNSSVGTFVISTTIIIVDVQQLTRGIHIKCKFQYTLSNKCYVQLVSEVMDGYYERVYLEGEREASHNFTELVSGVYTILVYGQRREGLSFQLPGDPDYITIARVATVQPTSVTSQPSMTHNPSAPSEHTSKKSFFCIEGVGFGIGVGSVATAVTIVLTIIMIKMVSNKKKASLLYNEKKPSMQKNVAYEVHNPLPQLIK